MKAEFVVLTNPISGKEREFHRWYDEHHLSEICEIPGVISAQRRVALGDSGARYISCAIYTIDHSSPDSVVSDIRHRWSSGQLTPTDTMDEDILMQLYA